MSTVENEFVKGVRGKARVAKSGLTCIRKEELQEKMGNGGTLRCYLIFEDEGTKNNQGGRNTS